MTRKTSLGPQVPLRVLVKSSFVAPTRACTPPSSSPTLCGLWLGSGIPETIVWGQIMHYQGSANASACSERPAVPDPVVLVELKGTETLVATFILSSLARTVPPSTRRLFPLLKREIPPYDLWVTPRSMGLKVVPPLAPYLFGDCP